MNLTLTVILTPDAWVRVRGGIREVRVRVRLGVGVRLRLRVRVGVRVRGQA